MPDDTGRHDGSPGDGSPGDRAEDPADGTRGGDQDQLAVRFSDLARTLQQQDDPHTTLVEIVRAAVALIPGADEGSISVVIGRQRVTSGAASSDLPRQVDALQEQTRQGPCLDAAYQHQTVRVPDMATEQRWPQFARRALQAGAASMLSLQLYVDGGNLGALNLYSRTAGAFDAESEHVALLFASHAAIAYDAARKQSGLTRSVATRQLIGQAQGILMERHKVTADQAFALLVRASQATNVKLRDVAEELTSSGSLPTAASRPASPEHPDRIAGQGSAEPELRAGTAPGVTSAEP